MFALLPQYWYWHFILSQPSQENEAWYLLAVPQVGLERQLRDPQVLTSWPFQRTSSARWIRHCCPACGCSILWLPSARSSRPGSHVARFTNLRLLRTQGAHLCHPLPLISAPVSSCHHSREEGNLPFQAPATTGRGCQQLDNNTSHFNCVLQNRGAPTAADSSTAHSGKGGEQTLTRERKS